MFSWDESKRLATLEKHGIDFIDVVEILVGPHLLLAARSGTEARHIAVGVLNGIAIAVIFTMRGESCRIITARRARRDERHRYETLLAGRYP